jgi:uncharacterized membrane protein YhiD involved in acid resistance
MGRAAPAQDGVVGVERENNDTTCGPQMSTILLFGNDLITTPSVQDNKASNEKLFVQKLNPHKARKNLLFLDHMA